MNAIHERKLLRTYDAMRSDSGDCTVKTKRIISQIKINILRSRPSSSV